MARFSVGGDEDGTGTSRARPLPKRPRNSTSLNAAAAAIASAANPGNPAANPGNPATNPNAPLYPGSRSEVPNAAEVGSDGESDMESDPSFSESGESLASSEEEEDQEQPIRGEQHASEGRVNLSPSIPRVDASTPVSVTLTDPDVLDCPICLEPLSPPVYQCENGHIACASCCTNMRNKCPSCSMPVGYNRCRAIEKILDSVKISCTNLLHGCKESIHYSKKLDHEKACFFTPCTCPYQGCDFVYMSRGLYLHFASAHLHNRVRFIFNVVSHIKMENSQKQLFLQDSNENILFILDRTIDSLGSLISVICIAPTSSNRLFSYAIAAKYGESSIRIKSVAENIPKWIPQSRTKKYFLVPSDFISSSGSLTLELIIMRAAK